MQVLRVLAFCAVSFGVSGFAFAQVGPVNGMRPADLRTHAITNATVIPSPGEKIEDATVLIRNGVIIAVGPASEIDVPAGAWVWPGDSLTVYAGLIEPALLIEPQNHANASPGSHWNSRIVPEIRMSDQPAPSAALRKELRELGFTTAAVYPSRGILRGTGNVIALAENDEHALAYRNAAHMAAGFDYGGRWDGATYPGSLMGAIALFRQTMLDAQWHSQCRQMYAENPEGLEPPIRADALVALADVVAQRQGVLFEVSDEQNALRAARLADEFDLDMTLLGSGLEFRRLDEIAALNMPIVVPVKYPERPSINTLATADRVSLRDMMTWEQAPTNLRRLLAEGIHVAITTHALDKRSTFFEQLRKAIAHGLTEEQALAALTTTPASMLGIDDVVGTIAPGKTANLVVVKGGLFEKDAKIRDVWVSGRRHEISKDPDITFIGKGILHTNLPDGDSFEIEFDTVKRTVALIVDDEKKISARNVTVQRDQLSFIVDAEPFGVRRSDLPNFVRFSGAVTSGSVTGMGVLPSGAAFTFTIEPTELRQPDDEGDDDEKEADEADEQIADEPEDDDARPTHDDPIAGVWEIVATVEEFDEPIDIKLTITRRRDGGLRGTSEALGTELPISDVKFDLDTGVITYMVDSPGGPVEIVGIVEGESIRGSFTSETSRGEFTGERKPLKRVAEKEKPIELPPPPEELVFPLGEYGFAEPPAQQDVLILGATIWTSGPDGIIEDGDMYVKDGKVAYVGPARSWAWMSKGGEPTPLDKAFARGEAPESITTEEFDASLRAAGAPLIIEAGGRHITPGLIDAHSHTGITGGVNEWTNVNTAEVRIADVINPDDINWYRQLAGGLTAANQLHGSANPIGGQNSIVKLKWGAADSADAMRINDARLGIKFALGENVVRSESRYPNTRMGVETALRDAFTAAREYEAKRNKRPNVQTSKRPKDGEVVSLRPEGGGDSQVNLGAIGRGEAARNLDVWTFGRLDVYPPRPDLQLDTLVEILNSDRDIHCHSYRQDEILALMRVAEDFGFTIGTLQHILEGYKVAEVIAEHGANASAFSDWWAYKVEVMDAIPYAGALMHEVGVNVSFNSDSSELARRMNTEAAKAVRYGGVTPDEALKFVTINPAIQMGIDHRTGALEVGKDADFVIWSGDPLSTYTRCEQTWIEGAKYFDIEEDAKLRKVVQSERQRLIQRILLDEKQSRPSARSGDEGDRPAGRRRRPRLMETVIEQHVRAMENMIRMGIDSDEIRPGDCGCNDWWYHLR